MVLVIAGALALVATDVVPVDVTALGVVVSLLVVSEGIQVLASMDVHANPVVLVTPQQASSGFASTATSIVLATVTLPTATSTRAASASSGGR